jgi:hypothetical protein
MTRHWLTYCSIFVLVGCGTSKGGDDASKSGGTGGMAGNPAPTGGSNADAGNSSGMGGSAGTGATLGAGAGSGGNTANGGNATAGTSSATGGTAGNGANAGTMSSGGEQAAGGAADDLGLDPLPSASIQMISLPSIYRTPYLSATYYAADYASGCTSQTIGPCTVSQCSTAQGGTRSTSGAISISISDPTYQTTLTPVNGIYTPDTSGHYFSGGEHCTASAPGDSAPGFDLAVDVPLVLLVSSPALDAGATNGTVSVPRDTDLAITWTRGAPGVHAAFQADADTTSFICTVESTDGELTIPAAVLGSVPAGTAIIPFTASTAKQQSGDWTFDLVAVIGMYTPDKSQELEFELE